MAAIAPSAIDKTGMTTTEGKDLTNSVHYNADDDDKCMSAGPLHGFRVNFANNTKTSPKRKCNITKNNKPKCSSCRSRHLTERCDVPICSSCGKELYAKT